MKNTLEGSHSRIEDAEEQIGALKDRVLESNQAEQKKEKKNNKNRIG